MFDHLIGNQAVKSYIGKLFENGRFPNSAIFAGPDGIGKKAFAIEAARAFVCTETHTACGKCGSCRRVGKFNIPKAEKKDQFKEVFFSEHPDVGMVVPFNRTVLVDAIRHLEAEAYFRPYEARARVFIIDDADKMNDAASNALLKTLEEPAATSYIFLVTSRPDSLLQTIRSRSHMIRFTAVDEAEIAAYLTGTENWSPDDATLASRICGGSIARALVMDIEKFRASRSAMLGILESLSERRLGRLLQSSERLNDAKNKDDFEANLSILESMIRDAWLLKLGREESSLANCDIAPQLAPLAANFNTSSLAAWLTEIETIRGNFAVNINRKIASDAIFVKMAGAWNNSRRSNHSPANDLKRTQ